MNRFLLFLAVITISAPLCAQKSKQEIRLEERLQQYFYNYQPKGQELSQPPRMLSYQIDDDRQTLTITADEYFAAQEFTPKVTANIYRKITKIIPKPYNKYKITVITNGMAIDQLIPYSLNPNGDKTRTWGKIDYNGEPWTQNITIPYHITHGLQNRHLSLWASHGRYYDVKRNMWKWQRPALFGTNEDLFTQTIVVPYLIPMLEKAGAIVFTPRERDWQKHEVIVDNDNTLSGYQEDNYKYNWVTTPVAGFSMHNGNYQDNENPFIAGTARMVTTSTRKSGNYATASYQPYIPQSGKYAVYVSYQSQPNSIDDAHYVVWHKGIRTEYKVNQTMGSGTWVYLGTFEFDKGNSRYNRVEVSNKSNHKGVVTTDAVRFGGGMGNIMRGNTTSGLPRCLEGARYYAQWAGMPYSVYSSKNGEDDYGDDINTRSLMTNTLAGGSCYMPTIAGRNVPIELSLAVHSDAGYAKDGNGLIGSLSICTTGFNEGQLNSAVSRLASRDLATALLTNTTRDIKYKYGKWSMREIYDRNYSETRIPEVPSAILETMSHQNFPDMRYGQDPSFRFTLARSIYKTLLRYTAQMHGTSCIVQPLPPTNFCIDFISRDEVRLSWLPQDDPQEPTSKPTGYVLYQAIGASDFDNGTYINARNSVTLKLDSNIVYSFKVAAVNRGGESFTSEVLSALYNPRATKAILIVNGFHRVSSPAIINTDSLQGFNLDDDPGITYGPTAGWLGKQINFDKTKLGIEDENGLGYTNEQLAGTIIAGNDMNYVRTHANAIAAANEYSIASCSKEAIETGRIEMENYFMTDIALGLEKNDGHSLGVYKTFSPMMQSKLTNYTHNGGRLLVSGAYIASDMTSAIEQNFLINTLKIKYGGVSRTGNGVVSGLGTTIPYFNTLNEEHYATTSADVLLPANTLSFNAMAYSDGQGACVAYSGKDYRVLTMGFPFECIRTAGKQAQVMKGILNYLIK